jgi:hypothetical protein
MKRFLLLLMILCMVATPIQAEQNPNFNMTEVKVYVYDAGDNVVILKNNFIWIYNSTGYVDSDAGTNTADVFVGLSAVSASYTAAASNYSLRVFTYASYQPTATKWNADVANTSGLAGAKVYWDAGTYTESAGTQTLFLTLDADGGTNRPIGWIERVVTAASKLYRVKFCSDLINNSYSTTVGTALSAATLDLTPTTNVDAIDITLTNNNFTTASAIDIDAGDIVGKAGGNLVDIDFTEASTLTGDLSIIKIDGGTNVTFNTATVNYRGIEIDVDAVTDTDFEDFYGLEVSMPAAYQGTDPTAGVYVAGHGFVSALAYGTNAYYGYYGTADTSDSNNSLTGLFISRDLTGAVTADRTVSNWTLDLASAMSNTSAGDFDLNWTAATSGVARIVMSHTSNTSVGAKTDADAFNATGLFIDIDCTTSEANTSATATARGFDLNYTTTQTLGTLNLNPTDIFRINLDVDAGTAISSVGTGNLNMILLDADGFVPGATVANATTFSPVMVDLSASSANDAQMTINGIRILMPTGLHTTAAAVQAINIDADTTVANATSNIVTTRDVNGTVAGAVAITNYANIFGQASAHSGGDFIVTQTANTAGVVQINLDHTVTVDTAAPDVFSSTGLDINVTATANSASADLDVAAKGLSLTYTLTETAGTLRMADSDAAIIDVNIPNGLSSAGAFSFDCLEVNADGVTVNDANLTFSILKLDASAATHTASANSYGAWVSTPAGFTGAIFTTDGTQTVTLSDGTNALTAVGASVLPLIDSTPATDADCWDIIGTNLTTASVIDANLSAQVSGSTISIALDTSSVTANYDGIIVTDSRNHDDAAADAYRGMSVEVSGNYPGAFASTTYLVNGEYSGTVNGSAILYAVRGDLSGATLTGGTYAAGYFADTAHVVRMGDGSQAIAIFADAAEANNAEEGLDISKDLTNSTAVGALATTNSAILITSTNATSAAATGALTVANDLVSITETNSTDIASADVWSGNVIKITSSNTTTGTGTGTYSMDVLSIDINLTETAGTLTANAFNSVYLDFDTSGTVSYSAGTFNLFAIDGDDGGVCTYAASTTFNFASIDLSGMGITDGDLTLQGLVVTLPATNNDADCIGIRITGPSSDVDIWANGIIRSAIIDQNKYYWVEEFNEEAAAVTLDAGLRTDEWTEGGTSGSADDTTYIQLAGGAIQSQTDGGADDSVSLMHLATAVNVSQNPIIEFRFQTDDVGAGTVACYCGFVEAAFVDKDNIEATADDVILVGFDSENGHGFGAANIVLMTDDNGGAAAGGQLEDMGVTISANTWVTVRIDCTDTEQPRIWVDVTGGAIDPSDEIDAASITGTIQDAIWFRPFIFVQGINAAAELIKVDYIKVWQDR